jgi:TctA family transporter|tara:strand:- start:2512 stop:3945 length:1434 start_codon:yes stop_codon:yes gene_type:complete
MASLLALLAGTFYGLIIGILPGAGATTGLIFVFSFITLFPDPYLAVIFVMAVVAASTTGDTYTGVLLGIPGANSAAATMIDGFPLALQGKATYAISAAVTTSTLNGLLWGSLTFFFLPYYTQLIMIFGVPELWAFTMLAMVCVTFVTNKFWFRSMIALCIGLGVGLIGVDPSTNADRWTGGWEYLGDGVQLMPLVAGLFAIPELLDGLKQRANTAMPELANGVQTKQGILAVWNNKWDALRGGFIGAFIGLLPGLGGAVADWMAYSSTVASHPKDTFGNGNIKGVIGPEGANNAQKATSMIPTVLFGIPGASFAAIVIGLFAYLDFELGTLELAQDTKFFDSMLYGFMCATVLVGAICLLTTPIIARIAQIPYKYYFPVLLGFIVLACVQYTGGWEDYFMLAVCSVVGLLAKRYKFSRPALLFAFILSDRIEALTVQMSGLYTVEKLLDRNIFLVLVVITVITLVWGLTNKRKIDYA